MVPIKWHRYKCTTLVLIQLELSMLELDQRGIDLKWSKLIEYHNQIMKECGSDSQCHLFGRWFIISLYFYNVAGWIYLEALFRYISLFCAVQCMWVMSLVPLGMKMVHDKSRCLHLLHYWICFLALFGYTSFLCDMQCCW